MTSEKFEDLNLSNDEIKRISDAMKDEKFRKLFVDYAEEISNPENKRLYEEELTRLESERGVDVTFINPEPGHVLKTSVDGQTKCFINICQNDKLDKPSGQRQKNNSGQNGLMWNIPHSFAPPRDDLDKSGEKCQVFDVVFHPDTYRMAQSNLRFNTLVENTALDGIEKQFSVKLDRKNIKRPNMKFKGTPAATVIRSKSKNSQTNSSNDFIKNLPNPYDKPDNTNVTTTNDKTNTVSAKNKKNEKVVSADPTITIPKYSMIHRTELDLQEYTTTQIGKTSTRPKELIITVELPLLKSAASADLDIFEKQLILESKEPAQYKLDLTLPYPVNEDEGNAKFDKIKRCLIITLPVLPDKSCSLPSVEKISEIDSTGELLNVDCIDSESNPLIEVLTSETPDKADTKSYENRATEDCDTTTQTEIQPSIMYIKPNFSFTQDAETINFAINVKNINAKTVNKVFPSSNSVSLMFVSLGSGCFPMHYSLYLQFPDDCHVATEHCYIDITANSLVLLVLKSKTCRNLWNSFKAGMDRDTLEDQVFLTEKNLQTQLDLLDEEAADTGQSSTNVLVTEMSQKKLTIKLQKCVLKEEEDEDYDTPLSSDIEVIHDFALPKLHSILKQRSISESSECEDLRLSPTSEGSRSDDELAKLNKSVSFNNRVDSTSFHSNKCPQSVKTTLHNKRKKARRKETLKQQRRERHRSNSTGSEYSSGDDIPDSQDHSDASGKEDFENITEEGEDVSEEVAKLAHAISKGFAETPINNECTCHVNTGSESVPADVVAAPQPLDFRTSGGKRKRSKGKGKGKKPYQGVSKCDKISTTSTESEDNSDLKADSNDKPVNVGTEVMAAECIEAEDIPGTKTDSKIVEGSPRANGKGNAKTDGDIEQLPGTEKSSDLTGMTLSAGNISEPGDLEKMLDQGDSSIVKIVANGQHGAHDSDDDVKGESSTTGKFNYVHKTQCAFNFSNSVIYDLDND